MTITYKYAIAQAVQTILQNVPNAPSADHVLIQEDESVQGRATLPIWIITMGDEEPQWDTTAGDAQGHGDIIKKYYIGISMYFVYSGSLVDLIANTPTFILAAQQALNTPLPVQGVWRSDLAPLLTFDKAQFIQGSVVARMLMIYQTSEPRNG